jgi:uncharacterized protein (TIGR03437 family)
MLLVCSLVLLIAGTAAPAQDRRERYVVRLRSAAVLEHDQTARAMVISTSSNASAARAAAVKQYFARLSDEHAAVRRWLQARDGAVVLAETELASNTLIVDMPSRQAEALRQLPEVADIFPDVLYHLTMDAALQLVRAPEAWSARVGGEASAGQGMKIGVIDTGLDPLHPMLQDPTLAAPSGYPKFTRTVDAFCLSDDEKYTNSKIIVARNYVNLMPRRDPNCDALDRDGHGTFSATVAAGRRVAAPVASVAGVAPRAYLGSYKVFGTPGTNDSATLSSVLAALDDAVRDGMDVINMSLGADFGLSSTLDPLSLAVRTAVNAGVVVVVAAGNDGPGSGTITSPGIAPEAITVGASSNARALALPVDVTASTAVPAGLQLLAATVGAGVSITAPVGPLVIRDVAIIAGDGSACAAPPQGSLQGAVALIERGGCTFQTKVTNARAAGAVAVMLFNNQPNQPADRFTPGTAVQIPSVMIGTSDGQALRSFVRATSVEVSARIGAALRVFPSEANRMAPFSSAGPTSDFALKPDLSAPGTNVYSGTQSNFTAGQQYDASGFGVSQGTSVSAPLVAGAAAIIRQLWPQFSPAQVKSALAHTAANTLLPAASGFSGVMAGGSGVLDLAAAVATPAVITPSGISLGVATPGTAFSRSFQLTIRNAGTASDTFTFAGVFATGAVQLGVRFNPASLTVAPGSSAPLSVSFDVPASVSGIAEGWIEARSQATSRALRVPYWGNFMLPEVNLSGVVNAASFTAGSRRIAPGGLISIFGTQLATTTASAGFLPLPTALAGVRVLINNVEAPLLFISPGQINAQVPYEVANESLGLLKVVAHGRTTAQAPFEIVFAAPGIFTLNQSGTGRGAVLHGASGAPVTDANPARPGEVLAVFVSGLGATSPAATSGAAATSVPLQSTTRPVTASIGGMSAPVSFSGLAPGFVGLYQVNVQVPESVAAGELTLLLNSADTLSNPITVPVQR